MSVFDDMEFESGDVGKIVSTDNGYDVIIDDIELGKVTVSGFPDSTDAQQYLMFGDWADAKDNDFVNLTNPEYELTWTFESKKVEYQR